MNQIIENHRGRSRAVLGVILLVVGCLLIANQLDIIPFALRNYIFTWQAILIFIGVIMLTRRENAISGYILIGIGSFFLLPEIIELPFEYRQLFWPVFIVILGILFIFRGTGIIRGRDHHRWEKYEGMDPSHGFSDDYLDDVNVFGGHERKINSATFRGGKVTSVFGGGTYDFTSATLAPGVNVLDMVNVFGGSKLIVPESWNVQIEVVAVFGGFSDKRGKLPQMSSPSDKRLVIKGVALFGGGEIKSY